MLKVIFIDPYHILISVTQSEKERAASIDYLNRLLREGGDELGLVVTGPMAKSAHSKPVLMALRELLTEIGVDVPETFSFIPSGHNTVDSKRELVAWEAMAWENGIDIDAHVAYLRHSCEGSLIPVIVVGECGITEQDYQKARKHLNFTD